MLCVQRVAMVVRRFLDPQNGCDFRAVFCENDLYICTKVHAHVYATCLMCAQRVHAR